MFSSFFRSSSSAESASSDAFPFTFESECEYSSCSGFFDLHKGLRKQGNDPGNKTCSVFVASTLTKEASMVAKRLRTLRHPSILSYIGSSETEKRVCIATESVTPLLSHLANLNASSELTKAAFEQYVAWGLYQVLRAIVFISNDANLVHYNIRAENVYVNSAGDWKLFGLQDMANFDVGSEQSARVNVDDGNSKKYDAPEMNDASKWRFRTPHSIDMWGYGCLIWEVYNGTLPNGRSLAKLGKIPSTVANVYKQCVAATPNKRPEPKNCLENVRRSGFFKNELIECLVFLEELSIRESKEKASFFNKLTTSIEQFPKFVCTHRILPELIKAFEFGNAGSSVLSSLLKIGQLHLEESEFTTHVVPCLIKMFGSNDRNARFKLLNSMESYVDYLSPKMVNDQIVVNVCSGFTDEEPLIREKTVIAIMYLAPKLSYSNLDEIIVLRHFSRLLRDPNPALRTNTTVCLGKIANCLHYNTRQKVLIQAFSARLRDPFPPARIAALNAFAATQQFVTIQETATKVVPAIAQVLVDPEPPVRQQAFKVMKGFVDKLEQVSLKPELKEEMEAEVKSSRQSSQVVAAAASWASWAVGAIGAKFYKSTNESNKEPNNKEEASDQPMKTNKASESSNRPVHQEATEVKFEKERQKSRRSEERSEEHTEEEDGWDDDNDNGAWADIDNDDVNKNDDYIDRNDNHNDHLVTQFTSRVNVTSARPSPPRSSASPDPSERRRAREERQRERRLEMENKREGNKKGPMKLGATKVDKKQLNDNLDDLDAWLK